MKKEYAQDLLKKTKQDYDRIAQEFSVTRLQVWKETEFLFDDYVMPGDKVLDLGCGNGRFFEFLKDKDIDYIGVDFSEKLIEIAKEKYPKIKFQVADALNLPFPNNYFDKIYSIAVLHHIPSEEFRMQFLKEARRILKPNGFLILTVWKPESKKSLNLFLRNTALKLTGKLEKGDTFRPWGNEDAERYFHYFSEKELTDLAEQTKFKIIKQGITTNQRGNRKNIYLIIQK
jgi:ubiquinone/menaquinone biosynthesis C-methylase UbiE